MKILFLGDPHSPLVPFLKQQDQVDVTADLLDVEFLREKNFDFLISYGYRYILKKNVLEHFDSRAINLHISYLPWNRGADPNFWSFVDDTPKGVTIHFLNEGVDTGDIIAQKNVEMSDVETLATSYIKLRKAMDSLFFETWKSIRSGKAPRIPQPPGGTVHRQKDKENLLYLLTEGWDTPVHKIMRRT